MVVPKNYFGYEPQPKTKGVRNKTQYPRDTEQITKDIMTGLQCFCNIRQGDIG